MTGLAQLAWDCQGIADWGDKVVMMAWAEHVEDGTDLAYCSKETVAESLPGMGLSTVKRRTRRLLKDGWLIDTGERKQWTPDRWTPIFRVNTEKIEAAMGEPGVKMTRGSKRAGGQNDLQGSRSSTVSHTGSQAVTQASAFSPSRLARSAAESAVKPLGKPKTGKPKTNGGPGGRGNGGRACPRCGEAWRRDRNHDCPMAQSKPGNGRVYGEDENYIPSTEEMRAMDEYMEKAQREFEQEAWAPGGGTRADPDPPPAPEMDEQWRKDFGDD